MRTTYPIVLAAGIARFDEVRAILGEQLRLFGIEISDDTDYFKGIATELRAKGFDVRPTHVPFADAIDKRAEALKEDILNLNRPKVHIIGHSMGGLDARHMIVDHGMAGRVASVTTIGTPHRGSSVAEFLIKKFGSDLLPVLDKIVSIDGLNDLTRKNCEDFNRRAEDSEARNPVRYQTCCSVESRKLLFFPLKLGAQIILANENEANDGLVPASSQRWTKELRPAAGAPKQVKQRNFPVSADHLNEIGWWDIHQLSMSDALLFGIKGAAERYEAKVRQAYLQIAEGLEDW